MLHPAQFKVNEAWIVFKLNERPLHTESDGDLDCIALMDAASCFILANAFASAGEGEPSIQEVRRPFAEAIAEAKETPERLYVPDDRFAGVIAAEAAREGIEVVCVSESDLRVFTGEPRAAFMEQFGGGLQ